jgi:hypothetical protein
MVTDMDAGMTKVMDEDMARIDEPHKKIYEKEIHAFYPAGSCDVTLLLMLCDLS